MESNPKEVEAQASLFFFLLPQHANEVGIMALWQGSIFRKILVVLVLVGLVVAGWQIAGGYLGITTPSDYYDDWTGGQTEAEILAFTSADGTPFDTHDPDPGGDIWNERPFFTLSGAGTFQNVEITVRYDAPAKFGTNRYFWKVFAVEQGGLGVFPQQLTTEATYITFTEAIFNTGQEKVYFVYSDPDTASGIYPMEIVLGIYSPQGVLVQKDILEFYINFI